MRIHHELFLLLIGFATLSASGVQAEQPNYINIFAAGNNAFIAELDLNSQTTDEAGRKRVNVRISQFSDAFRSDWIKVNFPGAESAAYAIDPYSVDCTAKTVGEHMVAFYDVNGNILKAYDYGGLMAPPVADSMTFELMKRVCGP